MFTANNCLVHLEIPVGKINRLPLESEKLTRSQPRPKPKLCEIGDLLRVLFMHRGHDPVGLIVAEWISLWLLIFNPNGYLFLHAQSQLPPYIGQVILLSPIVGEFGNEETRMNFIPPRAERLFELAQAGTYPVPKNCQIHVGADDWQSNPENVMTLGAMLGLSVTVVPNAGHMLPKDYVGELLDQWVASPSPS